MDRVPENFKKPSAPLPPLKVGDRVVWISDSGPEFGIVRWLGHLPGYTSDDWIAGVEFVSIPLLYHGILSRKRSIKCHCFDFG